MHAGVPTRFRFASVLILMRSDGIQTSRTTHGHRPVPLVPMAYLYGQRTGSLMTHPFWVIWPKSERGPRVLH